MYVPDNQTDLLQYLDQHQARIQLIANGSDLINRIHRKQVEAKQLVDLSGLTELSYVRKDGDVVRIGAMTTMAELAASPILDSKYKGFREVTATFGGPSIVNVATVGGNICSASSSEDLLPLLLVLDAEVRLRSTKGDRVMRLEEFVKGKRSVNLRPNEIMVETSFRELPENARCAFEKVGMRNSLITAFVNCAVYLKLAKTRQIEDIRIGFNRISGKIPSRARKTEELLRAQKLDEKILADAAVTLRHELHLTSDFRASEEYRVETACAIFKRTLTRCAEELGEKISV